MAWCVVELWLLSSRSALPTAQHSLCSKILDPILGPDLGKSSDGDTRRRKLMLNQSSDAIAGQRFKPVPVEDGFVFSACITVINDEVLINNLLDQDHIHNHKKLDNQLDYVARDLRLGNYPVHRNYLGLVSKVFPRNIHGLREADITRITVKTICTKKLVFHQLDHVYIK